MLMVRLAALGLALFSQTGCIVVGAGIYGGSRTEALDGVSRVMTGERPDLPADQAAACVVQGMKPLEVVKFGTSYQGRLTQDHVTTVKAVAQRKPVAACLQALPKTAVAN